MKGKKSWGKKLKLFRQFAKRGKTCLSRDIKNHGAKRQRREFPSQEMIPCPALYQVLNQGGPQYTAEFFSLLVHFRLPELKLTVETEGEGKMQASIPIPVHDLNFKCTQKISFQQEHTTMKISTIEEH